MKVKILIATMLLVIVHFDVFGGDEKTDGGKVIGPEFRKIRTDISLDVCETFNYNNDIVTNKIKDRKFDFTIALDSDTTDTEVAKKVRYVLGTWPAINGDDRNQARDTISNYLNQVSKRCIEKGGDTTWVKKYREKIKKIVDEYTCYFDCEANGDFSSYMEKYRNGLFKTLAQKAQEPLEQKQVEQKAVPHESEQGEAGKEEEANNPPEGGDQAIRKGIPQPIEDKDSHVVPIVLLVFVLSGVGYFIYRKKKVGFGKTNVREGTCEMLPRPQSSSAHDEKKVITGVGGAKEKPNPKSPDSPKEPESNDSRMKESETIHQTSFTNEWILVGTSVKGNGHIQSNMPCQDNHKFESLGDGWGVAIVSDGAGSAAHSELGSKVVAERGVLHFKNLIEKEGWMKNNVLPTDIEWLQKSYYTLKTIRDEVELIAQKNNIELKSLSATCLVVIYSPIGLLAVHVGDGRMGYKSASGEWRAMMTPHKGEEANQTIFLVSDFWSIPNYVMSDVLVPESIVVREPVKAFALMSDGCENTSWKCTTLNPETGKYYDQNKPFEGFFNPLEETLITFQATKVSEDERQAKWSKFIESGATGFVKEQDDKTMIYAYCCGREEIEACIDRMKNKPKP